jgi:hypothetical protein
MNHFDVIILIPISKKLLSTEVPNYFRKELLKCHFLIGNKFIVGWNFKLLIIFFWLMMNSNKNLTCKIYFRILKFLI